MFGVGIKGWGCGLPSSLSPDHIPSEKISDNGRSKFFLVES